MGHLGVEELRRVQRGLVDHHGHVFGLHALYDALDGARAEVIGVELLKVYADVHLGPLIAATLSAELAMASNAYSPSLTS